MAEILFLSITSLLLVLLLRWAFGHLPRERWQMLAVIPHQKNHDGQWQGVNLTYYGFFIATAQLLAVILLLILVGAAGISLEGTAIVVAAVLAACMPAARIVAIIVEKKRHTFTVGGASFVGILLAPWLVLLAQKSLNAFFPCHLPVLPMLAAMAVAYTLGEGLGRLACISFGCCYGKPLRDCHPWLQRVFAGRPVIFEGHTKKAIYEGSLAGEPLIPIQAITCVLYCLTALTGSALFLAGQYAAAFLLCCIVTQAWRIVSETLRADFRGFTKISAYQKMAGLAVIYVLLISVLFPGGAAVAPSVVHGLGLLWQPGIIIGLQVLWLIFFVVFGRSTITSATLSFQLIRDRA